MSFCKDCIAGVRHEGTPEGKFEEINGVRTYIALPSSDFPKEKAILYLTDILGFGLPNAQLMADDFARNGFQVYVPDYLNGDPVPAEAIDGEIDFKFINKWLLNHLNDQTRPPLDKVIAGLKAKGVTDLGATGYCFGARYVFDLAFDGIIKAAVASHPSHIEVEDLEKYSKTNVPLLINSCEIDHAYPADKQAKGDEILGNGKFTPGYERTYWEGCTHGFAARGDVSDPKVKAGFEGSFKATVEWFIKHL